MAIAFDTSVDGGLVASGTSLTWSHTCTGSNLILFVSLFGDTITDPLGNIISGVTYNGAAMHEIGRKNSGVALDRWCYLFYLSNPSTGAHNIVASATNPRAICGLSSSYSGVSAISQPDSFVVNSAVAKGANTDYTTTLTTTQDNDWSIIVVRQSAGNLSPSTGSHTVRISSSGLGLFDSNTVITPPGAYSMSAQSSLTANMSSVMASFSPFIPGGGGSSTITQSRKNLMNLQRL